MNVAEMTNEELDTLKLEIKAREQAIKTENAKDMIKTIFAGCFIKFKGRDGEQFAKVVYINMKGCSTESGDKKKFIEFERILEVLETLPVETPVEVPAEVVTPAPLFGKKAKK